MIHKKINLKELFPQLPNDVYLESFCWKESKETPYKKPRAAAIVLPGGGYNFCSEREAEPVAIKLMANDISVFVLNFTTGKFKHPLPFVEVLAAISYIRENHSLFNIDPNKIGLVGFSAGGNLAANCSLYYSDNEYLNFLNLNKDQTKVNFCVLGYAVTDLYEERKESLTQQNISQGKPNLIEKFSAYKHVSKDFPPTFIWTTKEDTIVPYRQSEIMVEALKRNNVKHVFKLYDKGEHGGSTCDTLVNPDDIAKVLQPAKEWIECCANFIKEL